MNEDFFKDVNRQQKAAIKYVNGPSLVLAGAGSGKTRVLTKKALYLIDCYQIPPQDILMVTFTNKAALEMKSRIKRPLGFVGTFHSFCGRVLRVDGEEIGISKNFLIYDEDDQKQLIKKIIKKKNFAKNYHPQYFLDKISGAKNQLIDENQYHQLFKDETSKKVATIYQEYQKSLKENNALDFDDLIFNTVKLLITKPKILKKYQDRFKYLLVDEFQDTNYAQYLLTKHLAKKSQNITVVGDFSQSIYSWRGAEIDNLNKFKKDFPKAKIFYLERNYRSSQKILDFAYQVISKNQTHPILKLYTTNPQGEEVVIKELENEQFEALFIAEEIEKMIEAGVDLKSIAIFYRMNAQSRVIEETFLHLGIPYILVGGTRFYQRREIKDILAYLRLIVNPNDKLSKERALKLGKKRFKKFQEIYPRLAKEALNKKEENLETITIIDKIFEATGYLDQFDKDSPGDLARLENIKELRSVAVNFPNINNFLDQVALVESEYSESEKKTKNHRGVHLMTLHQAKGLEFPYVFIVGVEEGILPHSRSLDNLSDLEEERRLFYVGITRAKKNLYITYTKKRFFFGQRSHATVSRFLEEADEDIW